MMMSRIYRTQSQRLPVAAIQPLSRTLPFVSAMSFPEVWEATGCRLMDSFSFLRRRFQTVSTLFLKHLSNSKRTRK